MSASTFGAGLPGGNGLLRVVLGETQDGQSHDEAGGAQRQLRNGSAQVLREVQAGQTLIVARSGVPIAELRPVSTRRFVPRAAIAAAMERSPRVDGERFRSEIDAIVEQAVDG